VKSVGTWCTKYEAEKARSAEVKQDISKLEQEITQVGGKVTVLVGQQNQITHRDPNDCGPNADSVYPIGSRDNVCPT
jgi:structural maintenance of chromosome 3 (chondroitin sulfate proteoglycan 6)